MERSGFNQNINNNGTASEETMLFDKATLQIGQDPLPVSYLAKFNALPTPVKVAYVAGDVSYGLSVVGFIVAAPLLGKCWNGGGSIATCDEGYVFLVLSLALHAFGSWSTSIGMRLDRHTKGD